MEKVRPWCGQPSDQGWLRNRTEQTCGALDVPLLPKFLTCHGWQSKIISMPNTTDDICGKQDSRLRSVVRSAVVGSFNASMTLRHLDVEPEVQ